MYFFNFLKLLATTTTLNGRGEKLAKLIRRRLKAIK